MHRQRTNRYAIGVTAAILGWSVGTAAYANPQQGAGRQPPQQPQQQQQQPQKVDLDELEDAPEKYLGKTVVVEGEVERVLGPHLFTIDERQWKDPERELPVFVPEPFTAMVRSDAPVRVTGTVQKLPIAEVEKRRGFFGDAKIRAEIQEQPVLVASEVTTVAPAAVSLRLRVDQPVGTSGPGGGGAVTDVNQAARSNDTAMVGRRVDLKNVEVTAADDAGFWIRTPGGERIFVMPANRSTAKEGQMASVQGVILELPEGLRVKINAPGERVYIYANEVTPR
jgi:hypothetical protein